jgi:hypothetical protein
MSNDEFFTFLAWTETTLCRAPHGELFHMFPQKGLPYVIANSEGQPVSEMPFTVERVENGFALRDDRGYLSAEFNGSVGHRKERGEAETFALVKLNDIKQANPTGPALPLKPRYSHIPKIIHQTYSSPEIPEFARHNVESLRQLNPGWVYQYWSDKNRHDFIYQYYGWDILQQYLRINPRYGAARADLFRYLLIYQLGGVYLDIKSGCKVPFDEIIRPDDQYLLAHWENGPGEPFQGWGLHPVICKDLPRGEYQQWHIIAAPGHPFLEHVINSALDNLVKYIPQVHGTGMYPVLAMTGPIAYTLAIASIQSFHSYRLFDSHDAGLKYSIMGWRPRHAMNSYKFQTMPIVL